MNSLNLEHIGRFPSKIFLFLILKTEFENISSNHLIYFSFSLL